MGINDQPNDMHKTVSAVSQIFSIMTGSDDNLAKTNAQRKRFYEAGIQGISFPEDWDSLPEEEKKLRLDKIDSIGLGKKN
jgi:phosphatidylethanolamine-binding protein (PEBP) family uncharacterized protein